MMSISPVNAGAAASGYYKTEGYYAAGSEEEDAAAHWFGKAAEELGLEGRVDDNLFAELLDGQVFKPGNEGPVPDRLMGRMVEGKRQHRPGLDLTFSAPKSVSIAALVFEDDRLIAAHDKAVKTTMAYVEQKLVQTRFYKTGALQVETGGKIIAGLFRHDTSRLLDPQLHTHAVIANMVENSSGRMTAIHNDLLYKAQKLGSEIYRHELAQQVHEAGYTVKRVGKERLIEITEVPPDLTEQFSKRRTEMEAALKERGMADTPRNAELAALATRAAKQGNVDREALQAGWLAETEALGLTKDRIADIRDQATRTAAIRLPGVTKTESANPRQLKIARDTVAKAIAHVSERAVRFTQTDFESRVYRFADGAGFTAIAQALQEVKQDGRLIPVNNKHGHEALFIDRKTLETEREMTRLYRMATRQPALALKGYKTSTGQPNIKPTTALDNRLSYTSLTDGQKDAVRVGLTGRGRVVGVQGYAGTGKTFMLAHLAKEAARAGYQVEGLAPSHQAVTQLADALPHVETLQARLLRQRSADQHSKPHKTILVVDEASMISTKQMVALFEQAETQKIARVILVGDAQQLDAVAAGTPFDLLQKIGMRTAVMDDIQRQRSKGGLALVKHAIAGEVQAAFKRIGSGIIQSEDIAEQAAKTYLAALPHERDHIGLVTPTNHTRAAINAHVRAGLRKDGTLDGESYTVKSLAPLHLTRVEAADPRSYKTGDVIIPHQSVPAAGLVKGKLYDVIDVYTRAQHIILKDRASHKTFPFAPAQNSKASQAVSVYEEAEREFAAGDKVKFRIPDRREGITNGETGIITHTADLEMRIKLGSGKFAYLDWTSLAAAGMDHAYALTTHDFQGATVDKIIVAMGAYERLADQKNFYVAVSRARDDVTLITDNPHELAERLASQTGEKISALEAYVETESELRNERILKAEEEKRAEKEPKPEVEPEPERSPKPREEPAKEPDDDYSLKDINEELRRFVQKQLGDYER